MISEVNERLLTFKVFRRIIKRVLITNDEQSSAIALQRLDAKKAVAGVYQINDRFTYFFLLCHSEFTPYLEAF